MVNINSGFNKSNALSANQLLKVNKESTKEYDFMNSS